MLTSPCLALRGSSEGKVFDFKGYARCEAASARQNHYSLANPLKSMSPRREARPHTYVSMYVSFAPSLEGSGARSRGRRR